MARRANPGYPGGAVALTPGTLVSWQGQPYKVRQLSGLESVLIEHLETGHTASCHPMDLHGINQVEFVGPPTREDSEQADLSEFSANEWATANALLKRLQPLMDLPDRKRSDVGQFAASEGVNVSTVYDWIRQYQECGHVSSLIKRPRGRRVGMRRLSPEVEAVYEAVKEEIHFDQRALPPATVIEAINERCAALGLKPPHANTIRNRLAAIDVYEDLGRRGNKAKAKKATEPTPGIFPDAPFPLSCVQIDHFKLDIRCVDEGTRRPIKKDIWVTLAFDVCTRIILGYFLGYMKPSSYTTGVCLFMAIMRKDALLTKLGLPGRWPAFGMMRKVHADNAKEFKGKLLQRAADEHKIDLQLRPVKTPRYGGHIERMIGNINREMHKKRGTTHSNPRVAPDYDSEGNAIYTLAEIETDLVDWIVNTYHVRPHRHLKTTPLRAWEVGLLGDSTKAGIGLPEIPPDHEKLRLDFLPPFERTIQTQGVEYELSGYYHEILNRWINAMDPKNPTKKRKFLFRDDPRDVTRIWFYEPDLKRYFEIPNRDASLAPMSRAEYKEARHALVAEGQTHVDGAAIAGRAARSRAREEEALRKTQVARQSRSRSKAKTQDAPASAPGSGIYAQTPVLPKSPPVKPDIFDDPFSAPIQPRTDIKVRR